MWFKESTEIQAKDGKTYFWFSTLRYRDSGWRTGTVWGGGGGQLRASPFAEATVSPLSVALHGGGPAFRSLCSCVRRTCREAGALGADGQLHA